MTISDKVVCQITNREVDKATAIIAESIRPDILALIQADYPSFNPHGYICKEELDKYRADYIQRVMEKDKGELSDLEKEVLESMQQSELLSKNLNQEFAQKVTLGGKVADKIASFGGSWPFIAIFLSIIAAWIVINSLLLLERSFDPFPYILLNLVLGSIAALQAPVIMMSQNRQESKDRLRAEHDYKVNLKSELEIRNLHEKMDHLLTTQWQHLLEIQQIQTDLLEEILQKSGKS
jgi:uncharacterized membrane protein